MATIKDLIASIQKNPANVRFNDLVKICDHYFGEARHKGSHYIYKMPWPGDPRVNIQRDKSGKAKAYQVRQVLAAIKRLEEEKND